jgi:hypothetical protein
VSEVGEVTSEDPQIDYEGQHTYSPLVLPPLPSASKNIILFDYYLCNILAQFWILGKDFKKTF